MKPFAWHPEAHAELLAAVAYYDGKREGLGSEFREELETALARVQRNPRAFPMYEDGVIRKCILQRFPYTVFFEEFDQVIWIRAVAHHKQRPGYWLGRTAE